MFTNNDVFNMCKQVYLHTWKQGIYDCEEKSFIKLLRNAGFSENICIIQTYNQVTE